MEINTVRDTLLANISSSQFDQTAAARELFINMQPMTSFDDMMIREFIERIIVNSKTEITVRFRGGFEVSGTVEK